MTTRQAIIDAARSYLGVPYHVQGRTRAGMDCAGLILAAARDAGVNLPSSVAACVRAPEGKTLKCLVEMVAAPVELAQPGDLYLMRFDATHQHLAMATERGIIHSYAAARRVVEHRLDETWTARIIGAYALPGVA